MLKRAYSILKRRYLNSLGYQVPEKYQSTFVCWGGAAEVQYIYGRFLKELPFGSRILIVGVMGGRDYFYFKNLGYKVTALDLGNRCPFPPITLTQSYLEKFLSTLNTM